MLAALAACTPGGADPQLTASGTTTEPPPRATGTAVTPATTPSARREALTCRSGSPLAPRAVSRFIAEGIPTVEVLEGPWEGTMHDAAEVRIGGARFVSDVARGELVPLFRRRVTLDADHELILGWSSWGGGEQSLHAWIVEHHGAEVAIVDRLEVRQLRGTSALFLQRTRTGLALGFPPPDPGRPLDGPWLATETFALAHDAALPHHPFHEAAGLEAFCPPFGVSVRPEAVTWIGVRPSGFRRMAEAP